MYQLYKGDTPLATFVPKDASELPYSNGVSVKDKIDSMGIKLVNYTFEQSAQTGNFYNITIPLTSYTGFTPIGVMQYQLNSTTIMPVKMSIENNNLVVTICNKNTSQDIPAGTRQFTVLYVSSAEIH